mmetsp:Transcript_14587/g.20598  ORF Transcript_14587/g.20598 Transcript_14587/m.20598 type:complete len:434 (+) Transcript_14587:204-1505(+)
MKVDKLSKVQFIMILLHLSIQSIVGNQWHDSNSNYYSSSSSSSQLETATLPSQERPLHRWLQPQQQRPITTQSSPFVRGGDSSKELVPAPPPVLEPEVEEENDDDKYNNMKSKTKTAYEKTKSTLKKVQRTKLITFLLLRFAFLLLLPLSTFLFATTLAFSALMFSLQIITLTFLFSDVAKIVYATCKASLAILLACVTGLLSPPFAIFGLVAAFSISLLEMAEPVIRMKYKREMKKMAHLQKVISDPVLLETLSVVMKSASSIAMLGGKVVGDGSKRIVGDAKEIMDDTKARIAGSSSGDEDEKGGGMLGFFKREAPLPSSSSDMIQVITKEEEEAKAEASRELVETLLSSPEAIKVKTRAIKRLPEPVLAWIKEQFQSIRDSGVLEMAASRALAALQRELKGAVEFMPYLEAIEKVRNEKRMLEMKENGKK